MRDVLSVEKRLYCDVVMASFSWSSAPKPVVALAPMAGVTDASYRRFIKRLAPETIVYSEFLSTDAIHFGARKTLSMLAFDPAVERPFIVQIFGDDPGHFLSAAKVIEQLGADGIDINMGCPAAKVVSSCHGAALLKDADLAAELVHATKKAVSIPVSVKTRLGWNTKDGLIAFCTKLVEAGADALAVHGRRYCDKFTGAADWEPIYELKRALPNIPVIGNGDIATAADAVAKIGNLDGVMVGRGTWGNPWLMADITEALRCHASGQRAAPLRQGFEGQADSEQRNTVATMTFTDKIPFILEHCTLAVDVKGEKRGMLEMRRHLSSYVKGFPGAADLRMKLMQVERLDDVRALLVAV
ncbi:MAG: tRNA-dihydrouridine synthase [Candidatus Peregrinibacteria bacterium Gr01-1014_25]|nr:MAG: tRNA-dihydrouridine synthase [Candidatus Peregrinibacteria bacterium Gr01-1014_25]